MKTDLLAAALILTPVSLFGSTYSDVYDAIQSANPPSSHSFIMSSDDGAYEAQQAANQRHFDDLYLQRYFHDQDALEKENPLQEPAKPAELEYTNGPTSDRVAALWDDYILRMKRWHHRVQKINDDQYSQAVAALDKGDYEAAISYWDSLIGSNPRECSLYYDRGITKEKKGDFEGAIADIQQAIALNPKVLPEYSLILGRILTEKGDLDRAIVVYDKAISLNPYKSVGYNNRGLCKQKQGNLDSAIADYDQAVSLDPNNTFAYSHRGRSYYEKGDINSAIADYTKAILLNPKNSLYYRNRGEAKKKKGDINGAIADLKQAIAINPNDERASLLMKDIGGSPTATTSASPPTNLSNSSHEEELKKFNADVKKSQQQAIEYFPQSQTESDPINVKATEIWNKLKEEKSPIIYEANAPFIVYSMAAAQLGIKPTK